MYINIMYFGSKTVLSISVQTKIKFSKTDNGNEVQILFIQKLESDLDPEPEKLCEHWTRSSFLANYHAYVLNNSILFLEKVDILN